MLEYQILQNYVKNLNFGEKSKFYEKYKLYSEIVVKNQNFWLKANMLVTKKIRRRPRWSGHLDNKYALI